MWHNLSSLLRLNISVLALFVCDRVSKGFALLLPEEGFIFLKFFRLKLYINSGIAFSIPVPRMFTIAIIVIALFFFGWALQKAYSKKDLWSVAGFSYIIVGAISNGIDRLVYEGVIDFIDLRILPVFNLADVMIIVGVGIIVIKYVKQTPALKKVSKKS